MAFAELLDIVGVIGLHGAVAQAGNLPGAAGFIILHGAHDTHFITRIEDLHAVAIEAVAIIDAHAVVHIGFAVINFHIAALVGIHGDNTGEGHLLAIVGADIAAQLLQIQFHSIAVVEIGVRLAGEHIQFQCSCLHQRGLRIAAIVIAAGVGGNGQAVLQQFQVQIAVVLVFCGLIPDPDQVTAAGGVRIPSGGIGFQKDGNGIFQLLSGKLGSCLAILFDFAGGFRGVDRQEARLKHAAGHHIFRNMEMDCIAVYKGFDRNLLLQGEGIHVELHKPSIIHRFHIGGCGGHPGFRGDTTGQNTQQ